MEHVAHMKVTRNAYGILVGLTARKPETVYTITSSEK
jgi:hypothetical protein